jgi:hypothetical protein
MSALSKAIITYIFVSIFTLIIENSFEISLNIYFYLELILEMFSDSMRPMLPTTGNWANSANNAIFMTNVVIVFFRVISSPIPLIAAIIIYIVNNDDQCLF